MKWIPKKHSIQYYSWHFSLWEDGVSFTSQVRQQKFARTKATRRNHPVFSPPPLLPSSLKRCGWPVRRCSLTRSKYQKYTAEKGGKDSGLDENSLTKVEKWSRKTQRKIPWVNSLYYLTIQSSRLNDLWEYAVSIPDLHPDIYLSSFCYCTEILHLSRIWRLPVSSEPSLLSG